MVNTSLLEFNQEGALSNMLAMEEHLNGQNNNGLTINTWCFKKHGLIAKNHHMSEMKTLLESENPEKAKQLSSFMSEFDTAMRRSNPSSSEIRNLRNEFREIIGDPTLEQPKAKCGVCALDKFKSGQTHPELSMTETEIISHTPGVGQVPTTEGEGLGTGAKVLIGVGVIAIATIIIIVLAKKK